MPNQQNTDTQVDGNVQGTTSKRSRNRPGSERQNEDLGEDENRAPNTSDENNTNAPRGRGGFRRGRGRGRPGRGYYQAYSNYMNGPGGYYGPPLPYYGPSYYGADDLYEQEGYDNYPRRGNRNSRGGRGRGRVTKNENGEEQQQGDDNTTNTRRNSNRRQQKTNDKISGTEQQTDGAVTDDQQQDKSSARQQRRRSDRRQRSNTNASQSGVETEERVAQKPKDDETIVKNLVRNMVSKVARRLAPRNRQRSGGNIKEAGGDVDQSQTRGARRGGRGRPGNDYFMQQGYYDPYGMMPYYYGMYYGYSDGRGRGRGGRGRGRFRQRGAANKENQPQNKTEESDKNDENSQSKPAIIERVNQ